MIGTRSADFRRANLASPWRCGLAVLAVALTLPSFAHAADNGLTLTRAEVPGFKASGSGAKVAKAALGGPVPSSLKNVPARGAAYSAGARRLTTGTFTLASRSRATTALGQAGRGFGTVRRLGDAARMRVRVGRKSTEAVVLLRSGRALGAVRLVVPGRSASATGRVARAHAATLAARLRRVLALTAWQRTLDGVRSDGSLSPALALRAFSIVYGPIPGVKRPTGRLGVPTSGTLAMQLVARVWDRLTAAQKAGVDRALGVPHDASSPPVARASAQELTADSTYQAIANKYAAFFSTKLAVAPEIQVFRASEGFLGLEGQQAAGDALPVNAQGKWGVGTPAYCRIRVTPEGQARFGTDFFEILMAHEVFHCFQFAFMANWQLRSPWLIEGTAAWAEAAYEQAVDAGPYQSYLSTPTKHLFARTYDATGFWHWADEVAGVGSLWAKIPAILAAPTDYQSFLLAGGAAQPFVESWASASFRIGAAAGPVWNQARPYAEAQSEVAVPAAPISFNTAISSKPFSVSQYQVLPMSKLVSVKSLGSSSLRAGSSKGDFGIVKGEQWFCFGGKCECPSGTTGTIPPNRTVVTNLSLALTRGAANAAGSVAFHTLEKFCKKDEKDDDGTQSDTDPTGPGATDGDPHLVSFDGLPFDFQAAGEFVLARSGRRDLEIQARQEPVAGRRATINTQLAMRLGGRRVTVSPGRADQAPPYPPAVRIDGAVDALPAGTSRAVGDGAVTRQVGTSYVDVVWPDGSTVSVRPIGPIAVGARIQLAAERANAVAGMLGDFDGSPDNDLADRNGKRIAYTVEPSNDRRDLRSFRAEEEFESQFFKDLYGVVGDSWRISQGESLFDYGPGQTTKTFTDRAIPTSPVDPDRIARDRRAKATGTCRSRGVSQPGPMENCVTDLAITGEVAFADDAAAAQEAAMISWSLLRAGGALATGLNLATSGDGAVHVAFGERSGAPRDRPVSVALDSLDREGAMEGIGPDSGSGPELFTGADGGVRAAVAEIRAGTSSGIWQYVRGAGGAWSPLGSITNYSSSYLATPDVLALPDGVPITASPMSGIARVFRGTGDESNQGVAPTASLPDCVATSPALARDGGTGAVWVAWVQWDCPQVGVFVQQVNPATGALLGTPLKAPGSSWTRGGSERPPSLGLSERLAFTGRPGASGVYLAFPADGDGGDNVRLWRLGDPSSVAIPKRTRPARFVRLAADPSSNRRPPRRGGKVRPTGGGLWIAWQEQERTWVQRVTSAAQAEGEPRSFDPPRVAAGLGQLRDYQIAARSGDLDVFYGIRASSSQPGAIFHARLGP